MALAILTKQPERLHTSKETLMSNLKIGDSVYIYASSHGTIANERIFEEIVFPHGTGPFKVVGVGPTQVAVAIAGKNRNVPHGWVTRVRLVSLAD